MYINKKRIKMFLANRQYLAKIYFDNYSNLLYDETTAPLISIYHYNPKPHLGEEIIIPLYFTDFYQREYYYDDRSLNFTLRYEVDGVVDYIHNLKAGDYNLSLGNLSKGVHWYSVQVICEGRESKRLFYELWVIDEEEYKITPSQIYNVTDEDLTIYKINKNNNSDEESMINNRVGLTTLLLNLKQQGYKKAVLPKGIYRVNRCLRNGTVENGDCPIYIPSDFTLDMNGSTIKLHPYDDREYGGIPVENLIISMADCHDSHLLNGIIEGDYYERKNELIWEDGSNAIANGNGEGNNALGLNGGSYSSVENVTITQTTGYNLCIGRGNKNLTRKLTNWENDKGLDSDGITEINKVGYSTIGMTEIPQDFLNINYMAVSIWLGYGGLAGNYWEIDFYFYDNDKNFIEHIKGYQYYRIRIPNNAKYFRVTVHCTSSQANSLTLNHMDLGRNNEIKNCEFIDNRTCVAVGQHQHLLLQNINFTRSGQGITPACIDSEDGWEQTQDIFFDNINVLDNTGNTREIILQSGVNLVVTNCKNARIGVGYHCHLFTAKENDSCGFLITVGIMGKNSYRVYNNRNGTVIQLAKTTADVKYPIKIKNTETQIQTVSSSNIIDITDKQFLFESCDIILKSFNGFYYLDKCNVYVDSGGVYHSNNIYVDNSIYYPYGTKTSINLSLNELNAIRRWRNCIFTAPTQLLNHNNFNSGTWEKCTFNSTLLMSPERTNKMGDIQFNNCIFEDDVTITIKIEGCYVQFNNCTFAKQPSFTNQAENNCEFNGCIFE